MRNIDSLRNKSEFDSVYKKRKSLSNKYLVMYINEGNGKVGIVVSKKVGNSIVRHRITRLIREAYRLNKEKLKKDKDIIILAKGKAKGQGFTVIEEAFLDLSKRQDLLN